MSDYNNYYCNLVRSTCKKKKCQLWKDEEMCEVFEEEKGCLLDHDFKKDYPAIPIIEGSD